MVIFAFFHVDVTLSHLLKPDSSLTHCLKEKEAFFTKVFDSKQSNGNFTE